MHKIYLKIKPIYGVILMVYGILPIFSILQNIPFFSNSIYTLEKYIPLFISGCIPYFLSKKKDGYYVIYGLVSYLVLTAIINSTVLNEAFYYTDTRVDISSAYSKNILFGVLCGCLAYWISIHFEHVKVPMIFSFFQGKRLIPVFCMFFMIFLAIPLYFIWKYLFTGIMFCMDFLNAHQLSYFATTMDIFLCSVGLNNIFNKFYIFSHMNTFYNFIIVLYLCMSIVICVKNRRNKLNSLIIFYFCLGTLLTRNLYMFSFMMLYISFNLWFMFVLLLLIFSSFFDQLYICILLELLFLIYLYKKQVNVEFHIGKPISARKIIDLVGGFENIKDTRMQSDYEIVVHLYNANFIEKDLEEFINISLKDDELILFFDHVCSLEYKQMNEYIQDSLQNLLL